MSLWRRLHPHQVRFLPATHWVNGPVQSHLVSQTSLSRLVNLCLHAPARWFFQQGEIGDVGFSGSGCLEFDWHQFCFSHLYKLSGDFESWHPPAENQISWTRNGTVSCPGGGGSSACHVSGGALLYGRGRAAASSSARGSGCSLGIRSFRCPWHGRCGPRRPISSVWAMLLKPALLWWT